MKNNSVMLKESTYPSIKVEVTYVNGDATSFEGCNKIELVDNLLIFTKVLTSGNKKYIVVLNNVCELSIE